MEIRQRIPVASPMDVLVRSPEEIAYRVSYNDWFLREITEKGQVLYGLDNLFTKILGTENETINSLTLEWVRKAEGDYAAIELHQQAEAPDFYRNLLPCPTVYRKISKGMAPRGEHLFFKNARFRKFAGFDCPNYFKVARVAR